MCELWNWYEHVCPKVMRAAMKRSRTDELLRPSIVFEQPFRSLLTKSEAGEKYVQVRVCGRLPREIRKATAGRRCKDDLGIRQHIDRPYVSQPVTWWHSVYSQPLCRASDACLVSAAQIIFQLLKCGACLHRVLVHSHDSFSSSVSPS